MIMSSETQFEKYTLLRQGIYVQPMTSPQQILKLIERLRPVTTWRPLIRVGSEADGGYLIPDDLKGISVCFSPGVGPTAAFESDLKNRFGIESHLTDYSVEKPPQDFVPLSFQRKFVGAFDSDQFTTLDNWIDGKSGDNATEDILLQIDIEGGEYPALLSLSERNLKRCRIIAAEFITSRIGATPLSSTLSRQCSQSSSTTSMWYTYIPTTMVVRWIWVASCPRACSKFRS